MKTHITTIFSKAAIMSDINQLCQSAMDIGRSFICTGKLQRLSDTPEIDPPTYKRICNEN